MITSDLLSRVAPGIANPSAHAAALEMARRSSTVNTKRRLAHFLGQICVETGGFRAMEESLAYRDPARLDAIFSAVRGVDDARELPAAAKVAFTGSTEVGKIIMPRNCT